MFALRDDSDLTRQTSLAKCLLRAKSLLLRSPDTTLKAEINTRTKHAAVDLATTRERDHALHALPNLVISVAAAPRHIYCQIHDGGCTILHDSGDLHCQLPQRTCQS